MSRRRNAAAVEQAVLRAARPFRQPRPRGLLLISVEGVRQVNRIRVSRRMPDTTKDNNVKVPYAFAISLSDFAMGPVWFTRRWSAA